MFFEAGLIDFTDELRNGPYGRYRERPHDAPVLVDCSVKASPATQPAEDVSDADEQWSCLHRRLRHPPQRRALVTQLYQAYEEATETTIRCD